jgi:hypothetical protein
MSTTESWPASAGTHGAVARKSPDLGGGGPPQTRIGHEFASGGRRRGLRPRMPTNASHDLHLPGSGFLCKERILRLSLWLTIIRSVTRTCCCESVYGATSSSRDSAQSSMRTPAPTRRGDRLSSWAVRRRGSSLSRANTKRFQMRLPFAGDSLHGGLTLVSRWSYATSVRSPFTSVVGLPDCTSTRRAHVDGSVILAGLVL